MAQQKLNISCHNVTLALFIEVLESKNIRLLSAVLPQGEQTGASDEALEEAWTELYRYFTEKMGDKTFEILFALQKRVKVLQNKMDMLRTTAAQAVRDAVLLKKLGCASAGQAEVSAKKAAVLLAMAQAEFQEAQKAADDGKTDLRAWFDNSLADAGRFMGYRIDPKTTAVAEFCTIMAQMRRHHESETQNALQNLANLSRLRFK